MRKIVSVFLIALSLFSCSSAESDVISGFVYDGSIDVTLTNSDGSDLLNPKTPNAYKQDQIKILYLVEGKLIQKANGTDYPRNFLLYEQDGRTVMRVFLNSSADEKYPETYIQWNESQTDILKIEFNRTNNSITKKTIWLNDLLKTDINPYLKIVK
ncbi:hypothetical protein [Flavobacterium sp. 245]|uniref:hypothetical protein n=1 Tax=Flavobacterium sp. 245 TaxID=2512115 RepID=UPI00105E9B1C|nr:hypothetical protein [Flavobacterium sp. 245]TDO97741.1 hypothetical protein EV145_109102 [Flavobacterium sp. 245]